MPGAGGLRSLRRGRARKGSGKRFLRAFLSAFAVAVNGCAGAEPVPTARGGEGCAGAGGGRPGLALPPRLRGRPLPFDFKDEGVFKIFAVEVLFRLNREEFPFRGAPLLRGEGLGDAACLRDKSPLQGW